MTVIKIEIRSENLRNVYILEEVEVVVEEMEAGGELEEIYNCEECQESFTNITEHMQKYHSEQETTEESVEFEIADEDDPLDQIDDEVPMAFVIKNNDGRFECSQCFQTYKSLKRFLAHVKSCHGEIDDENVKKLEEYLLKLENSDSLFELIEDENSDKMKYRCKICNTEFETKKRFLLHYPIHRNVAEARRSHRNVVKSNEETFHCQLCNRSLKNSSELKMHMNAHAENATTQSNVVKSLKKKKKVDGQSMYPCQVKLHNFCCSNNRKLDFSTARKSSNDHTKK